METSNFIVIGARRLGFLNRGYAFLIFGAWGILFVMAHIWYAVKGWQRVLRTGFTGDEVDGDVYMGARMIIQMG